MADLFPSAQELKSPFIRSLARGLGRPDDGSAPATIGALAALDVASQAQAEAGTDNATGMTPLRTAQAISALGAGGGTWTPTENSTNAETIEDADNETLIRLTHTGGPITVTMAAGTTAQKTGGVHKATTQPVTVAMQAAQAAGAGASYILPDGTTGTADLTLLGTFTWVCLTNSDADSAVYLLSGDFAIVDFRGARLEGYRGRKYGALSGAQTLSAANFVSGARLENTGAAATYTVPSRLGTGETEVFEQLEVRNRGSGAITWSASGPTLVGDTGTLAAGETAVMIWDHDGTTERVEIRSTA